MSGQALECGIGPAMSVPSLWGAQEEHQHGGHLQIALTLRDVRRWTLAAQASRRIGEELYRDSPKGSVNYFTFYTHSIFLDRKGLQAGFYAYFCAWASGGLIAALTVCMFYGAAHVTAWSFVFPTDVERLLWRIACIDTIAGVISLLAIFSIVVFLHEHGQKLFLKSFFTWEPGVLSLLYRLVILVESSTFHSSSCRGYTSSPSHSSACGMLNWESIRQCSGQIISHISEVVTQGSQARRTTRGMVMDF